MSQKKKLKQFWIDFEGSAMVEAKDEEEAKKKFDDNYDKYVYNRHLPLLIIIRDVEEDVEEEE
jgi:hypothetical protein